MIAVGHSIVFSGAMLKLKMWLKRREFKCITRLNLVIFVTDWLTDWLTKNNKHASVQKQNKKRENDLAIEHI